MLILIPVYHVDFRQLYVGSSVNVETTNINSGPISSSSDNEDKNSNQQTLDVISSIKDKNSTLECENKFADSNNYQRLKFKWNLSKSIFLEICGLSSVVALGWEYGQFRQKQSRLPCIDQSASLVKVLTNRALLPSLNKGVRLTINDVSSNSNVLYTDLHTKNTAIQASDKYLSHTTSLALSEEINENWLKWQNSVGVELINSAKKKVLSEYDHLIKNSKTDRFSAYQSEAFNCFLESRRLGSAKGSYNLGICYEQGIGTSQNLDKAFKHYKEAATKNHPAAQYNLGLLFYRRYLNNEKSKENDLSEAFSHLRQAAHHGLEEARSALIFLTNEVANDVDKNSTLECENKFADSNNYQRLKFKWNLSKSIFLEICGLSSVVALGWEYGQFRQKQSRLPCIDHSASLVKTLAGMLQNLETSNNLELAEWQNSVGVELINSAKKKVLSEYDHLIKNSKTDRFSAYQSEAFNCFLESRRLGSAKGSYNLGICYEQGIGTSQNLDKAFKHYKEAATKNHPAAQYNLGLLFYRRYLNNEKSKENDLSEAFSHLRQAAHHGLEEARSALIFLTNEVANDVVRFTTISSTHAGENLRSKESKHGLTVRNAFSEPHSFSYCHNHNNDKSEITNFEFNRGSVSFYFGD
uniref:Uncharacterized protein n=1 Tax=Daphnia galeata TaxID=27404 RepID=A0A8J2W0G1_9CRUS|nr:unnamed protein product [Daphnia galeata]